MPHKTTRKIENHLDESAEKRTYANLLLILLVLAIVIAYFYWKPDKTSAKAVAASEQELTLNVMPVVPEDVKVNNNYIGYVTPINSVEIVPYINGFLEDIMVEGGQEVKQGDTMIVIKQDEYLANLKAAEAKVQQAQANFNNTSVYYKRMRDAGVRVISKTELDNAKASYLSAQAELAQSKANQALAKVNYDYTVIQAPISGLVGNVSLTRGDYVSPASSPLLKIIQYDPIRVVFSITDKEYLDEVAKNPDKLFDGEKIQIRLSNGKIFSQNGQFQFMGNELDKQTNSMSVYADFTNPDKVLVANAYVDVLVEKFYPDAVLLRQNLVTLTADGNYVYTVADNKLQKKPVSIITPQGNNYVLQNNFAKGEYIVLDKVGRISPEQKIKLNIVDKKPVPEEKK